MFQSSRRYQLFIRGLANADLKVTPTWIEIIRTRNTKLNPCDENTAEYDQNQLQGIFEMFGCKPYYFNQGEFWPIHNCEEVDQLMEMEKLLNILGDVSNHQKYR